MNGQTLLQNKKICESAETKAGNLPIELSKAKVKEQRAKAVWVQTGRIYRVCIKNECLVCGREWHSKLRFANRPRGRIFYGLCETCKKELGLGEEDHGKE